MWFDDFSKKLFETIQSRGMKATVLMETDYIEQVNWSKVQRERNLLPRLVTLHTW